MNKAVAGFVSAANHRPGGRKRPLKWLYSKNNNQLYIMIRRSIVYLTVATVVLSSIAFYVHCKKVMLERAFQSDVLTLQQSKNASVAMQKLAGSITSQVYNDLGIAYLLYGTHYDALELRSAMITLDNYRMTIPYIDSIYLYNGTQRILSISASSYGGYGIPLFDKEKPFFDKEIGDIILDTEGRFKRYLPIPRHVAVPDLQSASFQSTRNFYTFLQCDSFVGSPVDSAVFVNFSDSWMRQMSVQSMDESSETLIVDAGGCVVSHSVRFPMLSVVADEMFYQRILDSDTGTGNFTQTVDGVKSLVTFIAPDSSGWRYVRISPYEQIVSGISRIAHYTVFSDVALIALGLVVSYVLSRRLYIPIGRVSESLRELEAENRRIDTLSSQHVLRNLLLGAESGSHTVSQRQLEKLHLRVEGTAPCRVLLIQMDRYKDFCNQFDLADRGLYRYAIMNIAAEILSKQFFAQAVDMGGGSSMAVILSLAGGKDPVRVKWQELFVQIRAAVQEALDLRVGCTLSGVGEGLWELPLLYRQAEESSFHRAFYPEKADLFAEDIMEYAQKSYTYPAAKEEMMTEAIMSGNAGRARELVCEIILETREHSYYVVNLAVSRVALSILGVINEVQKGNFLIIPDAVTQPLLTAPHLGDMESIEEILVCFCGAVDAVVTSLEDKRSARHTEILQTIDRLIAEHYADIDCCLDSIAQEIGMSPAYVGRLYKRYTLKSVAECIGEVRMEKARELLRDKRKLSVAHIALKTGFSSSSYFSKTFRKENGVTPGEFRSKQPTSEEEEIST